MCECSAVTLGDSLDFVLFADGIGVGTSSLGGIDDFISKDFSNLTKAEEELLSSGIKQELEVSKEDIERNFKSYVNKMDPTISPTACACCGRLDIQRSDHDDKDPEILSFTDMNLNCYRNISYQ